MKNLIAALKTLPFENKLCTLLIDRSNQNIPRKVSGYCFSEVSPEKKGSLFLWAGQLGDGRAICLGDLKSYELQLKGAGLTPYSRFADGKAVVRSSLREYLCSEYMHSLRIPTTRAASLVITDTNAERDIFYNRNQITKNCAVVLRIAETFFRFGSFEIEIYLNLKTQSSQNCGSIVRRIISKMFKSHLLKQLKEQLNSLLSGNVMASLMVYQMQIT